MGSLSRMSEECRKCPNRDKCEHKKMEACAFYDTIAISAGKEAGEITAAPLLRESIEICIGGNAVRVYKDDIAKELERYHFSERFLHYGA